MESNIEGFSNYYINEIGEVFNLDRPNSTALCAWKVNTGYLQVKLFKDNKQYFRYIHRLVALAHIPNPSNHKYVLHIDHNKTNCSKDNLMWGTNAQNTQDGYDSGAYKFKARAHKVIAVNKITEELFEFNSIRQLSESLGINRKTVSAILKGDKLTNNYEYNFYYNMPND